MEITGADDAVPQLIVSEPTDEMQKKVNFSFYLENKSVPFPDEVNIKICRLNIDPVTNKITVTDAAGGLA
ncbi:MAG: hypothetical protein EOO88_58690 [Pedobacter sp.]|nr:MAG: hypothetical protein EOO88_58690 [Pedobacter sp.]